MTLIISVLTEDAVLQASDRRLVWLEPDGSFRPRDDDRNKAVMFGKRMVFAYTGLANLGPRKQKTDDWLAQVLHNCREDGDQGDILDSLARETTARLQHDLYANLPAAQRGHEFSVVGWAAFPDSKPSFRPYFAWVSNLRDEFGQLLPGPATSPDHSPSARE